jgi:flagellar motor switch protein FliG
MTPALLLASPVKYADVPGPRKAAMFLMGIGDPISTGIIRQLAPEEIRRITGEITAVDTVPPELMLQVFLEFESLAASSKLFAKGGPDFARRLIEQAMGVENAKDILASAPQPEELRPTTGGGPFQNVDPQELVKVLREENPQTLSLVLSNLPPEQAGPIMASLPADVQPDVAARIAMMDRISPEVFRRIADAIRTRLKASRQLSRTNGARALADILNHVDGDLADKVLTTIEPEHQAIVSTVRQLMFVFEDVITVDKEGIKVLLTRVDRKNLTVALKGTGEKILRHFTQCMSQRAAEMFSEDMEAVGPVRIRDVAAAQAQVVACIRELQKEGSIVLSRGGDDQYVV